MPLNFSSSNDLPPLHPENPIVGSTTKLNDDSDDNSKTGGDNFYLIFLKTLSMKLSVINSIFCYNRKFNKF